MKTILYSLLAIFIFGIIATGCTNKANNSSQSILIQSVGKNISATSLAESAKIITNRLKSFSFEKFDVSVISDKSQIKVTLTKKWDIKTVENLLTQKGEISFFETYTQEDLSKFLVGDNHLSTLLNTANSDFSGAKIGCTTESNLDKVNDYLINLGLNQRYKFVWGQQSNNSEVCLYVLKLVGNKGALINSSEIDGVKSIKDKKSAYYQIEIRLKKSAVETWANATKLNINKSIAIVLDNKVISSPTLKSEISDGTCSISGDFTELEVDFIASIGSNGVLPIDFEIVK